MKKLVVVITLFTATLVTGQEALNASEIASYQTSEMKTVLNLGEEQFEKVAAINQEFTEKQVALVNEEGSMLGKMGRMRKIIKNKNEALEKILNGSQMTTYEDELLPVFRKHFRSKMNK